MPRLCEFITPARESVNRPTCPDNFFKIYHEKDRCFACPKAQGFNNGVIPRAEEIAVVLIKRNDRIASFNARLNTGHRRSFDG